MNPMRGECPDCDGDGFFTELTYRGPCDTERLHACPTCERRGYVDVDDDLDPEFWFVMRKRVDPVSFAAFLERHEIVAWGEDVNVRGHKSRIPLTAQDVADGFEVLEWIAPPSIRGNAA